MMTWMKLLVIFLMTVMMISQKALSWFKKAKLVIIMKCTVLETWDWRSEFQFS